jgi:hypothetical protein
MNPSDHIPHATDDHSLRAAMQRSLASSPAQGLEGLQARTLEQWREQTRGEPVIALGATAGWRAHPMAWTLTALALVAAVLLLQMANTPDPALDELLQPDVLSLISLGEL